MNENYLKEIESSLIDKYLYDMSLMCGESVVMRGIQLYLYSHDKTITNLSSFTSE